MKLRFSRFVLVLPLTAAAACAAEIKVPQRVADQLVVEALRKDGDCVRSALVVICAERGSVSPSQLTELLTLADDGAARIRSYLGEQLDIPGGNARTVEFFISPKVKMAHTTILHEPWILMPPRVVHREMVPYLHEMVHVMAQWSWRNSEWVAEGFADLVASAVVLGHDGYHRSFILPDGLARLQTLRQSEAGQAMLPLIGLPGRQSSYEPSTRKLAELRRSQRHTYAPPYYAMSWSFVAYLENEIGVAGLRLVAESNDPSRTLSERTGQSMAQHLRRWQEALEQAEQAALVP